MWSWPEKRPERGWAKEHSKLQIYPLGIIHDGNSGKFPLFFTISPKSPKLQSSALSPLLLGLSTHPVVHLGNSCASFVRLRKDFKSFSVYFILRTLREVERTPSLCKIYTDVSL